MESVFAGAFLMGGFALAYFGGTKTKDPIESVSYVILGVLFQIIAVILIL